MLTRDAPLRTHLRLFDSVARIAKSKWDRRRPLDSLRLAAFYSTLLPWVCPHRRASFTVGQGPEATAAHWITQADQEALRSHVMPVLKDRSKTWNPFLLPYRIFYAAHMDADIDVDVEVVISSGSSSI